ncbi:chorismate mutase [Nadsonia fulvescens var. elongata DSM 6958]|uniref:Chorismate mutase n=1 Tax=Nadsonia fulvescens var. elongata DSM 6958 TaxID=857566 RepID=A0A1E3PPZ4_9ASCO|nr:chorismate mutase [Nadsonia fulvescens var. elongata DSM 6958]
MDFMKPETVLDLANIRDALVRMEDTVLFNLIERAQFYRTADIYNESLFTVPGFHGSFLDWFITEQEKIQAKIRRYEAPDEVPFFPDELLKPILPPVNYPNILAPYYKEININLEIKQIYTEKIVPLVAACDGQQPENWGSTSVCDIECLQALSRRIHFGKFVAEAKYQQETERYRKLILDKDIPGIEAAITNSAVEELILERLKKKVDLYGVDPSLKWSQKQQGKINKDAVVQIYKTWVIPLTKKVEVDYLLRRLEE